MTMIDAGKKDHKIIAVATEDPEFNSYREAAEMPPHRLIMLRRFFQDYKQLEGKAVEVDEIRPPAEAYPIILDALHRYSEQRQKGIHSEIVRHAVESKLVPLVIIDSSSCRRNLGDSRT